LSQPLVSVIVNCYNGEKYLRVAIESVLAQTYQNWELIFWDNQSTDRSTEIFTSYKDTRLRYLLAPTHTLLYEARNCAIAQAKGEFVAFLDVDDWWLPEKLARQIPLFDDPEVGFVCSNYWILNETRQRKWRSRKRLFKKTAIADGWVLNDLLRDYQVGLLTLVVRRSAFDRLRGGCNTDYHVIGDFDLVLRLAADWRMGSLQEPLAFYRLHETNEGQRQRHRVLLEMQKWVLEQRINPRVGTLPAFSKMEQEVRYLEGLLSVVEAKPDRIRTILASLPWGRYKVKLLLQWKLPLIVSRMKQ
jgi:glycosyltransferase involved in cell wall biosynthesis